MGCSPYDQISLLLFRGAGKQPRSARWRGNSNINKRAGETFVPIQFPFSEKNTAISANKFSFVGVFIHFYRLFVTTKHLFFSITLKYLI